MTTVLRKDVIPAGMESAGPVYGFAPGRISNGFLFIAGQIGVDGDGKLAAGGAAQAELAFEAIGAVLKEAGCTFNDIVAMTTFHVGDCTLVNDWFLPLKKDLFAAPYPAWTSLGVTSLAIPGALIEITAIAELPRP